jgi:hypothetical protein
LEQQLNEQQYFGGDKPSAKDRTTLEEFKDAMPPNADLYPRLFFWWSIVSRYKADIQSGWA